MGTKPRIKPEPLPDFREMYDHCFGAWTEKHKTAAEWFGVTEQTCRRWYKGQPHPVAHRYLTVRYKGYLPYNEHWKDARIDSDGIIHHPWGHCSPRDLMFVRRYKWSLDQTSNQLKKLRSQLEEITSGSKYQMLLHTADYLNRLVQEFVDGQKK